MFLSRLFQHSLHYFTGSVLVMVASFITFPILTRTLTFEEYGIMALVSSSLLLTVNISKLGFNHSAVRFYDEFRVSNSSMSELYSTLFLTPMLFSLLMAATFTILPWTIIGIDSKFVGLMTLVALLIPARVAKDVFLSFIRSEQKTKMYNIFNVFSKYFSLLLSFGVLFLLLKNLYGYYAGLVVAELILFLYVILLLLKDRKIYFRGFSRRLLTDSIKYGFPLFGFELVSSLLSYGDRFLIQYYLSSEALAIYSVGYNCPIYISDLIILPLRTAILTIYINIWVNNGEQETKDFLSESLNYYFLVAIPIIFGVIVLKKDIITLLASSKYIESHTIIPYIIIACMLYGSNIIFSAGLFIHKKTYILTLTLLFCCIFNVISNIFLIPIYGIHGAAFATLLSYCLLIMTNIFFSFKFLRFPIRYYRIICYICFASLMYIIVSKICVQNLFLNLPLKIICGIFVYSALVLVFDKPIRKKTSHFFKRHLSQTVLHVFLKD